MSTWVRWLIQRMGDVPRDDAWLCERERATLAQLRVPKRAQDWRLGRWTAKRALASAWTMGARDPGAPVWEICAASDGAPEALMNGAPGPIVVSISHSAGAALCVVAPAGTRLGCDIERVEERSADFVADYFTPSERQHFDALPPAARPLLVTLAWSAKESALKAARVGLRADTREVDVTWTGDGRAVDWQTLHVVSRVNPGGSHTLSGWWRPHGNYVLTLVAEPTPETPVALGLA